MTSSQAGGRRNDRKRAVEAGAVAAGGMVTSGGATASGTQPTGPLFETVTVMAVANAVPLRLR
ncbi:MAG TPA: hypothetical protein VMB79_00425 [Jatrophihabitans sp.]|nr:hypothetical protein [Jatrophihabitans sp.]